MASWPREKPGPEVAVIARWPVATAPATMLNAETSVSAWINVMFSSGRSTIAFA